ncbi:MAG: hypothetical protein EOO09_15110 [Chitinophagaceae bacterium]|nr:MAG: hypothetical protein EOO09_15110 [Chitinophagaceae bacterium]
MAKGELDADSVFLSNLAVLMDSKKKKYKLRTVTGRMAANALSLDGNPPLADPEKLLTENQDDKWYQHRGSFSNHMIAIHMDRFTGKPHHYLPAESFHAELPNERSYPFADSLTIPLEYRLLALTKFQGMADYLFPHKYLTDRNLDSVVLEMIPAFISCASRTEYEILLLKLSASLNDTHSSPFSRQVKNRAAIFRNGFIPPFDYQVFDEGIVITDTIIGKTCAAAGLKRGDLITHINAVPVKKIIDTLASLISVSNHSTLLYRLSAMSTNFMWRSSVPDFTLTVNGSAHRVRFTSSKDPDYEQLVNYIRRQLQPPVTPQPEITSDGIAIFRSEQFASMYENVDDTLIDRHIDSLLALAANQKAIIFDMRKFIDWGGLLYTYVPRYFAAAPHHFADYYMINRNRLGTYVRKWQPDTYLADSLAYRNKPYKGKVVILTGPGTLSQTEWNTMSLQKLFPQAVTIGTPSAGADGDEKIMNLPGGYKLPFTGNAIFYPDGTPAQRKGVKVDRLIPRTPASVLKADAVMEAAIGYIIE